MDLSVVIVNFNTPKLINDCIRSIKNEGSGVKSEIVVVDNGSDRDSVELLKELQSKKLIDRLIFNKANLGFSKANNLGIKNSKGKYVLLLNSDTKVKKNTFKPLLDFAGSGDKIAVVGPKLLNKDGTVQKSCFNFPTIRRAFNQYILNTEKSLDKFSPRGENPQKVEAVVGAAFLLTPIALEKIGLMDERYFMYFEDLDYCRRANKLGFEVWYLPSVSVYHFHGQSGVKLADYQNQWRRLIPSSIIYHGKLGHYLLNFIIAVGNKLKNEK